MKKFFITAIFIALSALTGCALKTESSISSESKISQSSADASEETQPDTKTGTKETGDDFPSEEKVAPIVTIPSTFSADNYEPSFQTNDAIIEPLFELDGSEYIWDVLNVGYDFIMDGSGDILIVTYSVGEEPVEISEYARSIREEQGWEPPEILTALQELDTLEYIGRADFIEDKANAFEYHNSDLYYYRDKILLIEPIPTTEEENLYTSTMFVPCD